MGWQAGFCSEASVLSTLAVRRQNGTTSGADPHGGDHPRGSSPQALQTCKLGCPGLGGRVAVSPQGPAALSQANPSGKK